MASPIPSQPNQSPRWTTGLPGYPTKTAVVWIEDAEEYGRVEAELLESACTVIPVKSIDRLRQVVEARTIDFLLTTEMDALVTIKISLDLGETAIFFLGTGQDEELVAAYRNGAKIVISPPFTAAAFL